MADLPLPRPPEVLEGFRVGALRRSAGALAIHAATDRLDLAVDVHLVRADVMPGGADAFVGLLRRAADVRHESLLPYVTGGRAGDLLFAVAKTIDAPGLDEVIARGGALAEERVLSIGAAVASVLAAVERAGMRHGDLTARRIFLPGRGQVAVGPPRLVPASVAPRNDRYQSPEEARGGEGDTRSDQFVLGLLLAEALRGGPVVAGPASEVRRAIAEGRVTPTLPGARAGTREVIARLLAPDPARRFPSATAAESALRAVLSGAEPAVADAPVAVLAPLDEERPETAPIPKAAVQDALAQARAAARTPAPAAPAAPAATRTPTPAPEASSASASAAVTRSPGRLYLRGRLGDTLLEIDETVHVGKPASALDVAARPEAFAEAEVMIERTADADVVHALISGVTVNGQPVMSHALQHGDVLAGPTVQGRYERAARAALRATGAGSGPPPSPVPARLVMVAALLVALGGIVVSLPRFSGPRDSADAADAAAAQATRALEDARRAGGDAAPAPGAGGGAAASREQAARDAYEAARDWGRKNPGDSAGARARLQEVVDRYGDTGHAAIARAEIVESERASRGVGGGELDRLVAESRARAEDGGLDASLAALRKWADAHPGTVAGERATAVALQLENEALGRFEGDCARVERALAQKDWTGALRMVSRMMDYAPLSLRDRARELMRRAEAGRDGRDVTAGTPPAPEVPKPGTPGPGTQPPGPAPHGPEPGPGTGETPPAPGGDRDKEAEAAFRAAKRLMETGKDAEAIDALIAFLRDYKDTKPGARYDVEARGRITALAQGPAGVQKLFRGKSEKIEKGRWRIRYDFESADQLQDFRDVEAFEAPPRAQWKIVDGGARAKGSGSLVLDALFHADQIVVSVNVSPERAHDLGVTFLDGAEPRRFYLYTLQNSFFTLGKGDAAKVFEENAIVLFGPGMWRDTPPGQIGFVRKCGSPDPSVRPAETAPIKCGKSEAQVWMRMEGGKQISGSAYGDIKVEFQGIEPGVFVLNSSGSFDEFVVEGTPDPEWVARRWRAILSGL